MINKDFLCSCAQGVGVELSVRQAEQFDQYAQMLCDYNQSVNLTAITEPTEIVVKHFEDSLALMRYVSLAPGCKMADVGTGAGFPAVPLLIASEGVDMTLIEATNKKLTFIDAVLKALGLRADLLHMRGEEAGKKAEYREQFDVVTARAVANLRSLSEYCLPLVKVGGTFAAMKSSLVEDEIKEAAHAITLLGGKIDATYTYTLSNGDPRSVVLIKKISQTSPKYPRASAVISKKPL